MSTYTPEQLSEILAKHRLWMKHEKGGERANLRSADLSGAYLRGASGNFCEIKAIQCSHWPVTYTYEHMQIACKCHTIAEWWAFTDEEISGMDDTALDWWRVWKPILQHIIAVSPAVPCGVEPATEAS